MSKSCTHQGGRLLRAAVLAAGIGLAALTTGLTALAGSPPLAPKSVREYVDADERISGNAVVGAAFIDADDRIDPGQLSAFIDAPPTGDLTLEFNGMDGRYRVQAVYDAAAFRSGGTNVISLQLGKLQHPQLLGNYTAREGAILLTDAGGHRYPVRWGAGGRTKTVRIYLNAERTEAFFYEQTPQGRKVVLCETPQSLAPPFKFNRICDVPAGQLAAGPVQIQRRFGSRRMDPVTVQLAIAAVP